MKPLLLRWLAWAGLIAAMANGAARAQSTQVRAATPPPAAQGTTTSGAPQGSGAGASAASEQSSAPTPIPLAEISTRAVESAEHLAAMVTRLESSANVVEVETALAENGRRLQYAVPNTNAVLELEQRFSVLKDLAQAWTEGRQQLVAVVARTTTHTSDCAAALDELRKLRDVWTRTGEAARAQNAPEELIQRVDATLSDLQRTRERIMALRDHLLALQSEATHQLGVCDEMLARLEQSTHQEEKELGERTSMPLWRTVSAEYGHGALLRPVLTESRLELRLSAAYIERHKSLFLFPLLLFPSLVLLLRHARSRVERWTDSGPEIREHLAVLDLPYSVALLITVFSVYGPHPDAPRLLFDVAATILVVPVLRILHRIVHPALMPPIYGVAVLRVVDRVQDFLGASPVIEQILLCLAMGGGLIFMLWSVSPARTHGTPFTERERRELRGVTWSARFLALNFGIACIAGVFGYMTLARFASGTALVIVNAFLGFLVAARVLLGLWELSLGVRPLAGLHMVKGHRSLISRRSTTIISMLAIAGWLFAIRTNLGMLGLRMDTLQRVGTASVSFGSVTVSMGDLFLFGVTLLGSVFLSRLVRFVLDEELFPRFRVAHGLSYALSNLIHYAILTIGLLLALATLGFDASRLTVMIGALGVGIGFGLQAIVNNFVSGLILLFERPIKTGDTVQVGQITGEVKRIGVRSSTVRTASGAEVIVPNSTLISESVTNWTLSDRSRRFELPIGVAYGTKPATVLTMLKEVAKQHPGVLAHPEPNAVFLGFGDSALNFELRAWVADSDRLGAVKSEVAVALSEAFEAAGIQIPFPQHDVHIVEPKKA